MSVQYREYRRVDEAQVISLIEELVDFLASLNPMRERKKDFGQAYLHTLVDEKSQAEKVLLLAFDGETTVGFCSAHIHNLGQVERLEFKPHRTGMVKDLYVKKDFQGKGIGTALLTDIEKILRSKGCGFVEINVFSQNHAARDFYKAMHYTEHTISMIKKLS